MAEELVIEIAGGALLMKKINCLLVLALLVIPPVMAEEGSQSNYTATSDEITAQSAESVESPLATVLWDNGPFITHYGTGFGGADESLVQTSLGMVAWGWLDEDPYRVADEFTVPAG